MGRGSEHRGSSKVSMWTDNETDLDYLNFSGVAETVAELIVQAKARPISIGIAGAWGVGKSSMIKLVQAELENWVTQTLQFLEGYAGAKAQPAENHGVVRNQHGTLPRESGGVDVGHVVRRSFQRLLIGDQGAERSGE